MNGNPPPGPRVSLIAIGLGLLTGMSPLQGRAATALSWIDQSGYRTTPASPSERGPDGFSLVPIDSTGITFRNHLANRRSLERRGLLSGSGVAAGDIDGDGWCDLYFCGLDSPNELYRNRGQWQFEQVPPTGGIDCANTDATAAALADIDGDEDLDLIVTASGNGVRLFLNDGRGAFSESTREANLTSTLGSMSIALADIEGDGDLDLYVANFRPTTVMDEASTRFQGKNIKGVPTVTHVNGRPTTLPLYTNRFIISPSNKILELGQVDQLFLNDGKGRFTELPFTSGRFRDESGRPLEDPPRDWGLAVQMRDFTGDGAPDIYVCNDLYTPDRIWINQGGGLFQALPQLALRSTSTFSMGSDFADIDRDGDMDFFVVDMLSPDHQKRHVQVNMVPPRPNQVGLNENRQQILRNTLQLNLGDNTFAEISHFSGLAATDWSWGPIFLDVDLDGYEDVLVTNGQLRDFQNVDHAMRLESIRKQRKVSLAEFRKLINEYPELSTPNFAFRNQGDLRFEDMSGRWGFDQDGISQGMALADLDNDGDLDVIQNNLHEAPHLLRNQSAKPRIRVQLKGRAPNTKGVGARIEVVGAAVPQTQEILSGGRYLSSDQPTRTFAAPDPGDTATIRVTWRSGSTTELNQIAPNTICEIFEPNAKPGSAIDQSKPSERSIRFAELSPDLGHVHRDIPFNDMERQPLLPNRLSQQGPPLAWIDINGDSWDDLLVGSGRGGPLGVYRNLHGEGFQPLDQRLTQIPSARDYTAILPWTSDPGRLLIGLSNYEDGIATGDAISEMNLTSDRVQSLLNARSHSFGALALADLDRDGDLDLFVGGRFHPGRYPEPTDSMILENVAGELQVAQTIRSLGMVTGAVFTDLDGDARPELVVGREWGSLKIFKGDLKSMQDATHDWGIPHLSGWWNGVTSGDFNNDGRMDLIATNWGSNHKFSYSIERPLRLYYGDLDRNGQLDLVESYLDFKSKREFPVRSLRTVGLALPSLRARVPTFETYAKRSLSEIYGEGLKRLESVSVNHLEHTVFLNHGTTMTPKPLPTLAQLAPAFGVAVADFDADGFEDVFLCQNFFATSPGTHRYDAGRGLVLRGNGDGSFEALPHHHTGITIYGEQRAVALSDFNHDRRMDIAVTQNGASTKVFANHSPRQGIRVRLSGTQGNPSAIGAQARLEWAEGKGPVKEWHAGSGWMSTDSPTLVFGSPKPPTLIWVRWPDGRETRSWLPQESESVTIDASGKIAP